MSAFTFTPERYPRKPGCYLMKNHRGRVIYVGKAKNLRQRLSSYFQPSLKNRKAKKLAAQVHDIEIIIVNNEYESLVLENNLIKYHKPRFNRMLMADETGYYYIQLTGEEFPRLLRYRKNRYVKATQGLKEVQSGLRLGPYLTSRFRETLLEFVTDTFQIRTCKPLGSRVCLRYHLGKCSGICEGNVSPEDYNKSIQKAIDFLNIRDNRMLDLMRSRMLGYAAGLEFEKAQRVKEQIEVLEQVLERQIVERDAEWDEDVVYFGASHVLVMQIRKGVLQELRMSTLSPSRSNEDGRREFIVSSYQNHCPERLIIGGISDGNDLENALVRLHNRQITVATPSAGVERELLQLAEANLNYRLAMGSEMS